MTLRKTLGALTMIGCLGSTLGCDEEAETKPKAKPSAEPKATAPAPTTSAAPKPEVKKPSFDCPEGSTGDGTFDKPCMASGNDRIMEVTWNGKIKDKGPVFKVVSLAEHEVKYGRIVIYFYDKAGKQIELESGGKKEKFLTCGGSIFAGNVKPKEKIFVNFSCVKKDDVPEAAKAIEAEVRMVGFVGKEGNTDTYWRNEDLVPSTRPKGGVKAKKK